MDPGLLHEVGTAYADNGRFEQAEQLLRRSLAAGGETSSEVRLLLAQVLKYQNKYEVAIKEYLQVLMGGNSSAANKKAAAQGVQDMEKALATNLMKKQKKKLYNDVCEDKKIKKVKKCKKKNILF